MLEKVIQKSDFYFINYWCDYYYHDQKHNFERTLNWMNNYKRFTILVYNWSHNENVMLQCIYTVLNSHLNSI